MNSSINQKLVEIKMFKKSYFFEFYREIYKKKENINVIEQYIWEGSQLRGYAGNGTTYPTSIIHQV